jgi:hypothetical protein
MRNFTLARPSLPSVVTTFGLTDAEGASDEELAVAPAFASRRSRRPALQEAKVDAEQSELESSLQTRQDCTEYQSARRIDISSRLTPSFELSP